MALTRDFKKTVMADLQRDRAYRVDYLGQAIECLHGGEFAVGKRLLRDYINGTLGFAALSKVTSTPAKSLMRMLSESSNPHADKLFAILGCLQAAERVQVKVLPDSRARSRKRNIGREILQGIRQIKRGEHGRVTRVSPARKSRAATPSRSRAL
jgi:hypothetical protein